MLKKLWSTPLGRLNLGLWTIIATGILFRLDHLLEARSLWLDESYLALNIVESSYQQLLHHQHIIQEQAKAPLLFSLTVKLLTGILGSAEWVLRLFPFFAACSSLMLLAQLVRKVFNEQVAIMTLLLAIFCDRLIYYAAELKPYSTDVWVVLVLYSLYAVLKDHLDRRELYVFFAFIGVIAIWLSYPAILVLGALAVVTLWNAPREQKGHAVLMSGLWLINVLMVYKFSISTMLESSYITGSITEWFPQAPIWTAAGMAWLGGALLRMFDNPLGQTVPWISLLLFVVGCFHLYRRDRVWFMVLLLPMAMALVAACMGKYPFYGRHLLFLVPTMIVTISLAIFEIGQKCLRFKQVAIIAFMVFVCWKPFMTIAEAVQKGREFEANRAAMMFLAKNYQPGDALYMNTSAQYMFSYYADQLGLEDKILEPLVEPGLPKGLQGAFIGKIDDHVPEWSYEILVYDRKGSLTGKSYLGREELGNVQPWDELSYKSNQQRNWLILSHYSESLQQELMTVLDRSGGCSQRFDGRDAQVCLFTLAR